MKTELTFKQLAAAFVAAEARPCRRRRSRRRMYFATVVWLTPMPASRARRGYAAHPRTGLRGSSAGSAHELRALLTAVQTLSANANRAGSLDGAT